MNANITDAAGTYYPAAPGATTLADSKPLYINGERVSAVVDTDGGYSVFVGGQVVSYGQVDGTEGQLMAFFAAQALAATAETDPAVASVRAEGAELAAEVDAIDVTAPVMYRGEPVDPTHSSHSAYRAKWMRRDAELLSSWTSEDEQGYKLYISDGLADTDGHYAPVGRASWKAAQTA